ncbi:hypothetical protein BGZ47_009662 [Haplosporangium gracile]|nr:hypothetical protein BGZ47_009662 [Haplosporangium gracile]
MTHITNLPSENLDSIGEFLDNDNFLDATLVCRLFHERFTPILWKDIALLPGVPRIDIDNLKAHAHYVHTSPLSTTTSLSHGCQFLQLQNCSIRNFEPTEEQQNSKWASLVHLNPTARDINLEFLFWIKGTSKAF